MKAAKPRILVFSPFYPPFVGGLCSHAEQWNQHLAQAGYQITVFTPLTAAGGLMQDKTTLNLTVYRYPAFNLIPNYPVPQVWRPLFWQLLRQALSPHPHIIVTRTRFFFTSLFGTIIARFYRIKHLHIEHGSDYVQFKIPLANLLARLYDHTLGRFVLRKANTVIANSLASGRFVRRLTGITNVQVIYRGLDNRTIQNTPADPDIKKHHPDRVIITYLGRLITGKGVADLLQAVSLLPPLPIHILIIGDGPQRPNLKSLTRKLNLNSIVTFTGEKSFPQAIAYLKSSDIFVHPSYAEGIPTAVIEAALCQTAIIATKVGGTPEIVTNQAAIFVKPHQPAQIASALRKLIQNPALRRQLSQAAHAETNHKFTWKSSLQKYENLFT